ncbi:MAG: serine hydrolase [Rhodobacteraceae bacterium]|nr:serine hydrolase [Paracoccaceae bacterium]
MDIDQLPGSDADWAAESTFAFAGLGAVIAGWETKVPIDIKSFKLHENTVEYAEGDCARIIGPMPDRGPATGMILHRGEIVAQWGTPARRDVAFSVTKGCLSMLAGMALDRGLIPALDAPVSASVTAPEFGSANATITWRQLMTLTSEWQGSLWGIPDSIDFHRTVPKPASGPAKGSPRDRRAPGTLWEFNDVRVNVLALALTLAWGESLDEVLRREVMTPIGATPDWIWHGYDNAEIQIAGKAVPVVSGGAHWGGGLIASTYDLARLGLLYARRGDWGKALVSPLWFDALRAPTPLKPEFGLMWWNNGGQLIPPLSRQAIWSSGIANFLCVDPARDLVVVLRWYDVLRRDEILARIVAALPA